MSIYKYYLVCYDVADNKTRKRLFEYLKDLGLVSLQNSVFWGQLTRAEIAALRREAQKQLDPMTDKIFWTITNFHLFFRFYFYIIIFIIPFIVSI